MEGSPMLASVVAAGTELLISFDCETVGGCVTTNWMPNIGFVAAAPDGTILGELSVNMSQPSGTVSDYKTLEWFQSLDHGAVWATITRDAMSPLEGMMKIRNWIGAFVSVGYKVLLVAYPTVFDGSWLYAYWFRYLGHPTGGKDPGFTMLDIRSYASGKLNVSYAEASKEKALAPFMPSKDAFPHTHTGLDDAREQLQLYLNLRRY